MTTKVAVKREYKSLRKTAIKLTGMKKEEALEGKLLSLEVPKGKYTANPNLIVDTEGNDGILTAFGTSAITGQLEATYNKESKTWESPFIGQYIKIAYLGLSAKPSQATKKKYHTFDIQVATEA